MIRKLKACNILFSLVWLFHLSWFETTWHPECENVRKFVKLITRYCLISNDTQKTSSHGNWIKLGLDFSRQQVREQQHLLLSAGGNLFWIKLLKTNYQTLKRQNYEGEGGHKQYRTYYMIARAKNMFNRYITVWCLIH